jgi:LTXXQ motif family protein
MTTRSLRQSTPHISRSQGISRSVRRGVTGSRNVTVQNGVNRLPNVARSKGTVRERAVNAQTLRQNRTAAIQTLRQNRNAAIQKSVLRNQAFVGASKSAKRGDLARANFRGQFAGKHISNPRWAYFDRRRGHRHFFVIGWLGPVFWPYFYDDYIDYTFWPYEYDTFWPYAYDDVYVSVYGPYAYEGGSAYASAPAYREGRRVQRVPASGVAQVCSLDATTLTDWPIERITQRIELDDQQRGLLEDLKKATATAVDEMKSACPTDFPGTPTGRLAAMRARIDSMLKAISTVQPALERFYDSLNDEQKARFDAIPEEPQRSRAAARTNASQVCSTQAAGRFPIERIRSAIQPTQDQERALDALDDASRRAAERLKADCDRDLNLTAPARVDAMVRRLKTTLDALDTVQPALDRFYGTLSDEQKARFNRLARQA